MIASPEIGVMGFFYEYPLLDLFGLCSRKVVKYFYENYNNLQREDPTVYVLKRENPALYIGGMNLYKKNPLTNYLREKYKIIYIHPKYTVFGEPLYIWQIK